MEKIASFQIDHDTLELGMYTSRIDWEDIRTYDIRFKKPNAGDYLSPAASHTLEHLYATYLRSGPVKENVIYFGPMGCLTGFYLVLKGVSDGMAIKAVEEATRFCAGYTGEIPGSRRKEGGNCLLHDLEGAKREAQRFLRIIEGYKEEDLIYKRS